jgi:hypothetical protein
LEEERIKGLGHGRKGRKEGEVRINLFASQILLILGNFKKQVNDVFFVVL